jgi:hypothetical protein
MMKKIKVIDRSIDIDLDYLFDGKNFDQVKEIVSELMTNVNYGEDALFRVDPYGYDGAIEVFLDIYREETDGELKFRLSEEKKIREYKKAIKRKTEETELAELARLKAKYDK